MTQYTALLGCWIWCLLRLLNFIMETGTEEWELCPSIKIRRRPPVW
jgi:hypothetical protein